MTITYEARQDNVRRAMTRIIAIATLAVSLAACCNASDSACLAREDALGAAMIGGFSSGYYHPYYYAPQPVFIGCTRLGNVTNCIAQ